MERLTARTTEGTLYSKRGYEAMLARLESYEDTGLTPEEIKNLNDNSNEWRDAYMNMKEQWKHECDILIEKEKELQRYRQAEELGLLIKLPVGIHKYIYDIHFGNVLKHRTTGYEMDSDGRWFIKTDYGRIPFTDYGKEVFRTREVAEEELQKGSGAV